MFEEKILVVHHSCIVNHLGQQHTDSVLHKFLSVNAAIMSLVSDKASITVGDSNKGIVIDVLPRMECLFDELSAFDFEESGVARAFCENAKKVIVTGAYKSICISGASKVLERMGINYEYYDQGIIDRLGTKANPQFV